MRWAVLAGLLVYTNLAAALPGDRQRAENYYQRGAKAEALSDAAFKVWQQTIRVTYLDVAVDRWVYAVDQYSNATYYDPTHWRAHRRLGMLFAEAQGRHANDELALMHLVAYLALAPNDAGVARAKQTADARLARIQARIEAQKIHGEGHLDPDHAVSIGAQRAMDVYLASARSYDDAVKRAAATAQYAQTLPDMFAEQVYFNAELAERIAKRNAAAAPTMGGEMGGMAGAPVATPDAGAGGAPGAVPGAEGGAPAGAEAVSSDDEAALYRDLALVTNFVPSYLAMIGGMHRFMAHLEARRVSYDPRLPQALIGESIIQLRRLFTRGRVGDAAAVKAEYGKLARLEAIAAADLWSLRNYGEALPDYLLAAGNAEKPDLEQQYYQKATATQTVRLPGYNADEEETEHFAEAIRRVAVGTGEAQQSYLRWRNIQLGEADPGLGVADADALFVRDYMRLGAGEITGWPDGPLVAGQAALPASQRGWLVAGR